MKQLHVFFWIAGTVLPLVAAAHVLLSRRRTYPLWAKMVWIIGGLMGLIWGALGWVTDHSRQYGLSQHAYYAVVEIQGILGGMLIGFATIFALAKPYKWIHQNEDVDPFHR